MNLKRARGALLPVRGALCSSTGRPAVTHARRETQAHVSPASPRVCGPRSILFLAHADDAEHVSYDIWAFFLLLLYTVASKLLPLWAEIERPLYL